MHRSRIFFVALVSLFIFTELPADETIDARDGSIAKEVAERYMEQVLADEAEFRSLIVDRLGKTHIRFDQLYQGVPVFAGQTIIHVGSNGKVVDLTDARRQVGAVDMTPSLRAQAAVRLVKKAENLRGRLQAETKLMVYVADADTSLVWYVNLQGMDRQRLPVDWVALVDAHGGKILLS